MGRATTRSAFLRGARDGSPFVLVIVPFAMLFGLVAREAGWDGAQTMTMTALVVAGASQFTALQLLSENAPTLLVIVTALAVNLRLAMYSASLVPHVGTAPGWQRALVAFGLVDQSYGVAMARYTLEPTMGVPAKVAYFTGAFLVVYPLWLGFTWVGFVAGTAIPEAFALDFAVPITFIALVAPALTSTAHVAAAVVSVAAALALAWMPFGTGLLAAALAAMITGAAVEIWSERR